MSRINKLISFAAAFIVLLSFSAVSDGMLIPDDMIVSDIANYKTTVAENGAYVKSGMSSAYLVYPTEYEVRYNGAPARFVEYNRKRGESVKKGDLLATFIPIRDEVSITQLRLSLTRTRENYESGLKDYEKTIADAERNLAQATDAHSREIMRLKLEKANLQLEKYRFEAENSISDRKKALDELLASYESYHLYAPADATIAETTYLRDNEIVYDNTPLIWLYDPMDVLFGVNDNNNMLRYNMEISVSVGMNNRRVTSVGRVVSAYNVLPSAASGNQVLIRVTDFDEEQMKNLTRPSVEFESVRISNVTVIDRKAVSLYSGRYFVYKLAADGMVSKRYVNYFTGNAATGAWLLQGVEPGETLILD